MKRFSPLLLALFLLPACDDADPASEGSDTRAPIGKADLVGSCEDACGDQSPGGNCWCDASCVEFGDCCGDINDVCADPMEPVFCGGFGNLPCPEGLTCVDDPTDDCDLNDGADCGGMCVESDESGETGETTGGEEPIFCGGFGNLPCPEGLVCVDDPNDDCDLEDGADCGGICIEPIFCGGFGNLPCPEGLVCVDDPTDDCDLNDGADCGGMCV